MNDTGTLIYLVFTILKLARIGKELAAVNCLYEELYTIDPKMQTTNLTNTKATYWQTADRSYSEPLYMRLAMLGAGM